MYGFKIGEKVNFRYSDGTIGGPFIIKGFNPYPNESRPHVRFTSGMWDIVDHLVKIEPYQMEFSFMEEA